MSVDDQARDGFGERAGMDQAGAPDGYLAASSTGAGAAPGLDPADGRQDSRGPVDQTGFVQPGQTAGAPGPFAPGAQPTASAAPPAPSAQNGLAVAALVCGVVGIVLAVLIAAAGIALGVLGVVFGALGRRRPGMRKFSIAGIITGAVALVVGIVNGILGAMIMTGHLHL